MPEFANRLDAIPLVTTTAERGTLFPTPSVGQRVQNLQTGQIERFTANGWVGTLSSSLNVTDFGAVGDGVTDDTAAIQAAVDAANTAGGGRVYLPAGTYKVTADIVLPSDIELYGAGLGLTVVTGTATATTDAKFYAQTQSNVTIRDLTISGSHAWGILVSGGSNHRVERCAVSGGVNRDTSASKGGGVFFENVSNVLMRDCDLSGNGVADGGAWADVMCNFGTYGITDAVFENNRLLSTGVEFNLVMFDPLRVRVTGNTVGNALTPSATPTTGGYGIALYKYAASAEASVGECDVSHNHVRNTEGTGIYVQSVRDTRVIGNVLNDVCSEQTDATLTVAGVAIHDSPGCTVLGNRVVGSGRSGIGVTGLALNTVVDGNFVSGCTLWGIAIRGTVSDVVVSNNNILNCVRDGVGSWSDVNATRITVTGNTIRTITGGGYRGVYAAPTATAWTIQGNTISDLSGGGAAITAASTDHVVNGWTGSKTYDPGSIANGSQAATTVTVTGAALGDYATATFSLDTAQLTVTATVTATDTVTVVFSNTTGGAVDLASGTLAARVRRNC